MKERVAAIFARAPGGPKLWFDGFKFTNNGKPKSFGNSSRAFAKAKELLKRFGRQGTRNRILARYKVWIAPWSSYQRRENPESIGIERAAQKFEDFTGKPARTVIETHQPVVKEGLVIGELDVIGYRVKREGVENGRLVRYGHQFSKDSRPLLAVSPDGKQLLIVGGRYEFTEAGIEDR